MWPRLAALGLSSVVALTACAPGGSPSADPSSATSTPSSAPSAEATGADYNPTEQDFALMRQILAKRAAALAAGKRQDWLADVDPSNAKLRLKEQGLFESLRTLGVTLDFEMENSGFLTDPLRGSDPVVRPPVYELSTVRGVDHGAARAAVEITFVRRGYTWYIAADHQPKGSYSQPWYGDPRRVVRSGRLVVVTDRIDAAIEGEELASAAHDEVKEIADLLGVPENDRLLIDATTGSESPRLNSFHNGASAAAVFPVGHEEDGEWEVSGWRMKISPRHLDEVLENRQLLRHELAHFLLADVDDAAPIWVKEGIAEYVGYYPYHPDRLILPTKLRTRLLAERHELPAYGVFGTWPELSYPESFAGVSHLVQTYGMAKFRAFLAAYRKADAGRNADFETNRILRKVYGITERQLGEATWRVLESQPRG